jgi:hypothetical protein
MAEKDYRIRHFRAGGGGGEQVRMVVSENELHPLRSAVLFYKIYPHHHLFLELKFSGKLVMGIDLKGLRI